MIQILSTLSVIIINYNTKEMTLECLRTLFEVLDGIPAEVWVVDNASVDGSVEAIRSLYPEVRLIENQVNLGFGSANNQAIRRSDADFFFLLNSDAFPKQGSIHNLLDYLRTHSDVGIVGPRLLNPNGSLQQSCYRFPGPFRTLCENSLLTAAFPNHPIIGDYRAWAHDKEREVDFVIGACMMVRRSAVHQVGMFDESFFLYAEETDWCLRFRKAGWKIHFTPTAEVTHINRGSGKSQSEPVFNEFQYAQEHYFRKHHGIIGLWFFRIMQIIGASVRLALFWTMNLLKINRQKGIKHTSQDWKRILIWTLGFRGKRLARLGRETR